MSPRKPLSEPRARGESHKESSTGALAFSRLLILVEQMQGRLDALFEAVDLTRRALENKIEQLRAELKSEIAVLTSAVQRHAEQMERKAERAELALLDYRVKVLEQRVGISPA